MAPKRKLQIKFILVIVLAVFAGLVSYPRAAARAHFLYDTLNKLKINLGLDLQGGIHLEYKADVSQINSNQAADAMQAVQDVIERRVNAFGVAEPVIYTTRSGTEQRLVVELAGVKDIEEAKSLIKETPFLEFKEEGGEADEAQQIPQDVLDDMNAQAKVKAEDILKRALAGEDFAQLAKDNSEDPGSKDNGGEYDFQKKGTFVPEYEAVIFDKGLGDGQIFPELAETNFGWHIIKRIEVRGEGENQEFKSAHILIAKKTQPEPQMNFASTGLTGKNLKTAEVAFQNQGLSEPQVSLKFDDEGAKLFAEITKRNIGKRVAIYLDNMVISAPTVQAEITNGEAVITGDFSIEEAKDLVKRLNEGALPVPITLISQQSVEASLGQASLETSLKAGAVGLALVIVFMIFYYRFLGLIASFTLLIYTGLMISLFKFSAFSPWQITLTLSGIAGFILSIGMAVDANILIFERTKEEIRNGRHAMAAIDEGFKRAWTSIRDSNVSSIITALILTEMGTGFVKGFAVTLILGVLVSMFTAVVITRTILRFVAGEWINEKLWMIGAKK
ncbi:MAG: protein-export membrane protein SecD [Candidatus Moranbacteria bacterium RIFOXYA12_FULL_44_15]|nr:MAG: protein-export membrane protein SecD [Candidatus Moranbacteria bacterium RIFOXYA12_FULL_44_15]OGI34940.1 MAG: protein-export membrane protein SecD [Candidatus Moranbacteria bacterium RIFOXYA2_FULL_43_15]